ncbi:type VII secretion-associated protein [Corynebacterium tapiri]|uniref:Type VII secretion-associated protein n=1 Tax=Corynebacterium tapiri TaxID=1448266 RepID=A0A5C4U5I4_9CORY|nr:type VII secretion-associated protein [Corynebacterium tapiri]TNL98520.1 type VII secretion-associated protein [Corynebacterium tapiri]
MTQRLSPPPTTHKPQVSVTVFDTATVFDGVDPTDVVYRYDLPGTGVEEGWARSAVVDQIRALSAEHWPEVEVLIDAPASTADSLIGLLTAKGISARLAEQDEPSLPAEEESAAPPSGGKHRWRGRSQTLPRGVMIAGVGVLVALGCAAAGWAALSGRGETVQETAPPTSSSTVASSTTRAAAPTTTTPSAVDVAGHGFRVTLPPGFTLEPGDGTVEARGQDPNMVIHLAVDDVFGLDGDAIAKEVERLVESDPQLESYRFQEPRAHYLERPGDGSQVRWTTWVEGDKQLSVGCHFRTPPTVSQHATCSMAVDSVKLEQPG